MPLWSPDLWTERSSADRITEIAEWERQTIQPKYGITAGAEYTLTEGTAELYDYWFFFAPWRANHGDEVGRIFGLPPGQKIVYHPRRGFDLWNTRYFVLPRKALNDEHRGIAAFLPDTEVVYPPPEWFRGPNRRQREDAWVRSEDWQILRNKSAFPRAWVVHDARFVPPVVDMQKASRTAIMEEILYQADIFWNNSERRVFDPHSMAWVEVDDAARPTLTRFLSKGPTAAEESPVFVRNDPQHVEIDVSMQQPGIVILADVFYPGWTLTIDGKPAPILKVNRLMRGAAVESGKHHLVYRFDPLSFRLGAMLSTLGALGLIGLASWAVRQRAAATV
jgi:hypothetical protein